MFNFVCAAVCRQVMEKGNPLPRYRGTAGVQWRRELHLISAKCA